MSSISACNGVVNVDPSIYTYRLLGSTCPSTLRLNTPAIKQPFRFLPEDKFAENLALVEETYGGKADLVLYHMKRKDNGFLTAKSNPKDVADVVGANINYQVCSSCIELQVGQTRFTSDQNAMASENESVMVTDVTSILMFICGRIKVKQLQAASKRAQRQATLRQQMKNLKEERNAVQAASREKDRTITRMDREMSTLRSQLAAMATQQD